MKDNSGDIGMIIRKERRKQKLTLRDLAERTGINYSVISKYENGVIAPPAEKVRLIASALGISEDLFLSQNQVTELDIPIRRRADFSQLDDDLLVVSQSDASRQVVAAANGKCELCGQVFSDGIHFLEAHHIIWLRDGGKPTPENTVALCPNCHKRVHLLNDPEDKKKLIEVAKGHKTQ